MPVAPTSVSSGSLTSSGATITFSGGSGAISYTLDYGTTTGYGTNIAATSPQAITGLSASQLYDYRVNAVNSCGTTLGPNNTFTTASSGGTASWYFNANTNDNTTAYSSPTGTAMTKGSGTPGYTSDFTLVSNANCTAAATPYAFCLTGTGQGTAIGYALYRVGGNGYQFQIPTAGNMNFTQGTGSFIWSPSTIVSGDQILNTGDSGSYFHIATYSTTSIGFAYMSNTNATGQLATVQAGHSYIVQYTYNSAAGTSGFRVYDRTTSTWALGTDTTFTEATGLTGGAPTLTATINFGNDAGNVNNQAFDQIMGWSTFEASTSFTSALSTTP